MVSRRTTRKRDARNIRRLKMRRPLRRTAFTLEHSRTFAAIKSNDIIRDMQLSRHYESIDSLVACCLAARMPNFSNEHSLVLNATCPLD